MDAPFDDIGKVNNIDQVLDGGTQPSSVKLNQINNTNQSNYEARIIRSYQKSNSSSSSRDWTGIFKDLLKLM